VSNPGLAPLADYGGATQTCALLPGSPAIDAGAASISGVTIPDVDQRGLGRVGNVDIGAFESQGFTLAVAAGSTPQSAYVNATFANPLAVTVTANNGIEPVDGGVVTFLAPGSGSSATLSATTATIAAGAASVTATANGTAGGPYTVSASTAGAAAPASFVLTNQFPLSQTVSFGPLASAVYLRVAGANNSIVRDARVFLASPWSRRRLIMGPYSMDLRERVAAAIDEGEGSERQIAKRFRVSVSFVTRLLQRRRDAGTLAPKPHGGGPRPVLGFPEQVRLAMLIAEHPDATLKQLKEWGGFACTLTTLWRTLRRFRLTYKKKTLHAGERDTPEVQAKRRRYRAKVRRIEAKRLVFVDETGVNTAMTPTHAWARRGERAEGSVPSSWGSTTVIAALGLDGVRAPLVFPGATDTQAFQTYVDQVLVPELRPGDVVVFDNLKPHLSRHVAESIERAGATVLPLPPYSSDYDPIEELWSKFKGQLRRIAARTKDGLYKAVGETLDSVTIQDILGWFNHSGLYATHG